MRTNNKYHKFVGYGQKKSGTDFEDIKYKFYFEYYEGEIMKEAQYMFKGLTFGGETNKIITQALPALEVNDRVYIDGNANLITSINVVEEHKMGGQRFKGRKKTYVLELT